MANQTIIDILRQMRNSSDEVVTAYPAILKTAADVDRIVSPILYVIGFPGNVLAIVIWLQPRMRHSSGTYLAALGFVDLLFMMMHLMFELYKVWDVYFLDAPIVCELFPVVYMATQYLSPLLVLAFTVERFISVHYPLKRHIYCTTTRAKLVSFALAVFVLLLGSMQAYIYKYNSELEFCGIREAAVRGGIVSLWSIWTWITEMIVFLLVPIMILVVNVLIIRQIKQLAKLDKSHGPNTQTTTFSLLVVSFYFIVTTFPVSIVYAIRYNYMPSDNRVDIDVEKQANYLLTKTIIEEIGITHYACKFYIFLITERVFRQQLIRICKRFLPFSWDRLGYEPQTEVTARTEWNDNGPDDQGDPDETGI